MELLDEVANLFRQGWMYREIAAKTGLSMDQVNDRIRKARDLGIIAEDQRKRGPQPGRRYGPRKRYGAARLDHWS